MNTATIERKRTTKSRKLSPVEQALHDQSERRLAWMREYGAYITSSKAKSEAFLRRAGVIDEHGNLTEPYRDD